MLWRGLQSAVHEKDKLRVCHVVVMIRVVLPLAAAAMFAQSPAVPRFDVAVIKPNKVDPSGFTSGMKTGHGRLEAQNVTLKRCIMGAYGVGPHQIFGGPDWLDSDRFEINAKADQPVGDHVLMEMLQTLLTERFKLTLHRETRIEPALVLEVAKNGPKLEKAAGGESSTTSSGSNTGKSMDARNTTMDRFAAVLSREMDLPVVNRTGLDGVFNIKLAWSREDSGAAEGPSIFTAVQEQLGLRLRSEKAPVEVIVIDHAEQPSEN
jgi:uncharacterized protein (TIGR03435 family)